MSRFTVTDTALIGLKVLHRQVMGDARGFLSRVFCAQELKDSGWHGPIAQINHTLTQRTGTVRGMHYQRPPHAEMKLVSCLRGAVLDVAVDLRADSPTFLRWHAQTLSAENHESLLIPQGFAHGFQTLTDDTEMLYCHSAPYVPAADAGLNPFDARLAIAWPLKVSVLSDKDGNQAMIPQSFEGVRV
jgi:dTDP-4-dehydrorhamnose 3,5-epimerase